MAETSHYICPVCKGAGNYSVDDDDAEFMDCTNCNGLGIIPHIDQEEEQIPYLRCSQCGELDSNCNCTDI